MKTLPVLLLLMAHLVANANTFPLMRPLAQDQSPAKLDDKVEVMWSVLPAAIVKVNFGERASKEFYVFEIIVKNDTSKVLILESAGVKLAGGGDSGFTIPFTSTGILQHFIDKSKWLSLCSESVLHEKYIVEPNHAVRFRAFLQRSLLKIQDKKTANDPQEIRKLIADIFIVGRMLTAERLSLQAESKNQELANLQSACLFSRTFRKGPR